MIHSSALMCAADMAPGDSRASSEKYLATHHSASGPDRCLQPAGSCERNLQPPGQFRCSCDLQQSSCVKGDLSPKDASKRKRINRIAKLKQCKLDARREQWLSRGSHDCRPRQDKPDSQHTSQKEESPAIAKACPLSSSSDSRCTSRSSAESGSEDNDVSVTHETEDDWEVAADALNLPDDWEVAADALNLPGSSLIKVPSNQLPKTSPPEAKDLEKKGKVRGSSELQNGMLKPEYKCKGSGFGVNSRGPGGRAWRPDDVSRPPTLPQLSKQHSFPLESSTSSVWSGGLKQGLSVWGPPPVPSCCPICTEELDMTDSSFFPCSCGFRLCLFCHHKISSDDGRCPGCRKAYSPDVAMKLSCNSTTFWLRV